MVRWRLREIAEPERWNVKKLAEQTGLAYGSVYGIWNDTARRVDLDTLDKLAYILPVTPGELFAYEPGLSSKLSHNAKDQLNEGEGEEVLKNRP